MIFDTYIFDLDGTLLDTLLDLANAVNFAMRKMNYKERTVDEVRSFIGNGIRVLISRSVPPDTGKADYEKALELFTEYYLEHISDFTKPYDGITEVVDTLKAQGKKIAVVSNKADKAAKTIVRDMFGEKFDMVVGKTDKFPAKPAPDSVLYVIDTLGSQRESCIYIGDSEVDVHTAHNAGLPCVGVTWGNRDRAELEKSGAEFIVDAPSEIISAICAKM